MFAIFLPTCRGTRLRRVSFPSPKTKFSSAEFRYENAWITIWCCRLQLGSVPDILLSFGLEALNPPITNLSWHERVECVFSSEPAQRESGWFLIAEASAARL